MKSVLAFLGVILLLCVLTEGEKTSEYIEPVFEGTVMQEVGSYHLFRSYNAQEYLMFLENFDSNKYEIVDISTSADTGYNESGEFYIVTYKDAPR